MSSGTPLNLITAVAQILLDHLQNGPELRTGKTGPVHPGFGQDLTELVNDLLDLARVEAGKNKLYRPAQFQVEGLFAVYVRHVAALVELELLVNNRRPVVSINSTS